MRIQIHITIRCKFFIKNLFLLHFVVFRIFHLSWKLWYLIIRQIIDDKWNYQNFHKPKILPDKEQSRSVLKKEISRSGKFLMKPWEIQIIIKPLKHNFEFLWQPINFILYSSVFYFLHLFSIFLNSKVSFFKLNTKKEYVEAQSIHYSL